MYIILAYRNLNAFPTTPASMLLLLRRAPRSFENGPSERQHLLGVGREDSKWGRRTTKGVLPEAIEVLHLCSQCSSVCGSSLHSRHVESAAGSSWWTYALRSGVCPARRRARRTASALLEVAMQSTFQEKCS